MNSQYITLTRQDPDFQAHLLGTFSSQKLAIPVETYHLDSERERVTFRIISKSHINKPFWIKAYWHALRPELLGLTLAPALVMFTWMWLQGLPLDTTAAICSLLALVFMHSTAFLLNDFRDHCQGRDRMSHHFGSQIIQKGWVSAIAVYRWAMVHLALAVFFALPALYKIPGALIAIGSLSAICIWLYSFASAQWQKYGLSDFLVTLAFGPLMCFGIWFAAIQSPEPFVISATHVSDITKIGINFGFLSALVFQSRHFERLFRSNVHNSRSMIISLGFDQAKSFILIELVAILVLQVWSAFWFKLDLWHWLGFALVAYFPLTLGQKIYQAHSPLSSSLRGLSQQALYYHLTFSIWLLCSLWFAAS